VSADDVAMQLRCVHCLREQYALNVPAVSTGEYGCCWCGRRSQPMTEAEYHQAIRQRRAAG
jgi:hypothetical protein